MADEFDERLKSWVTSEIPGIAVSLGAPERQRSGRGVGLYLLEITPSPPPSTNRRPPLQLSLRYLITAWSTSPEESHQILVQLTFAAMESRDFQVEPDSIPMSVWTAFGVDPQPSLVLRMPWRRERPVETILVREPLKIQSSPVMAFHGVLLGPGDVPLSDCRVEVPALGFSTSTDHKGRFYFPNVPSVGPKKLLIKAKGRELPVNSDDNHPDSGTPLVVHFNLLEE